jgi:CheY-like chemotaxis protein
MIQVISAGLTLIEKRVATSADIKRYVDSMRGSLDRTTALANRLLAFSRRQALQPQVIEPARLVADMRDLLKNTLGSNIQLKTNLSDEGHRTLCDPHQLESALLNLSINARDAMPDGGTLTISVADREVTPAEVVDQDEARPGAYVQIRVTDTGTGMTPDVAARAFEPFFTTKPTGQGTGLGLSQVYGFVRQSGGIIRIESLPGQGASIDIRLPAVRGGNRVEPTPANKRAPDVAATGAAAQGRVLVVEDDEAVRTQISETLTDMGCSVTQARDGAEGLRILQSGVPIDLMITDIGLPVLNGRQLADAARALSPSLPIVLITGYAGKALDAELGSGMEILRKPFALDELTRRVQALLPVSEA